MAIYSDEEQVALTEWLDRAHKREAVDNIIQQWHIQAHVVGGVTLPYHSNERYQNVDVYEWDDDTGKYGINAEKSLDMLAKVAKFAAKEHKKVKKDYSSSSFNLEVTIWEAPDDSSEYDIVIRYIANRETVCRKVVVGYEDVPEVPAVPAHKKEVIEWECDPISLLAHEAV